MQHECSDRYCMHVTGRCIIAALPRSALKHGSSLSPVELQTPLQMTYLHARVAVVSALTDESVSDD
jgi:hypothetical protein